MKTITKHLLCFFLVITMVRCAEEEAIPDHGFPRLGTLPVTEVNSTGATYNAEFLVRGNYEITQFGFTWAQSGIPTIEDDFSEVFAGSPPDEGFSARIERDLKPRLNYIVRPFVRTNDFLVYGAVVEFKSRIPD